MEWRANTTRHGYEHEAILAAVLDSNARRADEIMQGHVMRTATKVTEFLRNMRTGAEAPATPDRISGPSGQRHVRRPVISEPIDLFSRVLRRHASPPSPQETLPGWAYTSERFYQRQMERIFTKTWIYVGRVERIPNAGDYFTLDFARRR